MSSIQHGMGDREMLQRFHDQLEIKQNRLRQLEAKTKDDKKKFAEMEATIKMDEHEMSSLRIEIKSIGEDIDSLTSGLVQKTKITDLL